MSPNRSQLFHGFRRGTRDDARSAMVSGGRDELDRVDSHQPIGVSEIVGLRLCRDGLHLVDSKVVLWEDGKGSSGNVKYELCVRSVDCRSRVLAGRGDGARVGDGRKRKFRGSGNEFVGFGGEDGAEVV